MKTLGYMSLLDRVGLWVSFMDCDGSDVYGILNYDMDDGIFTVKNKRTEIPVHSGPDLFVNGVYAGKIDLSKLD